MENGNIKVFPKDIENPQDRSFVMATVNDDGVEKITVDDDFIVIADVPDEEAITFSMEKLEMGEDRILVREHKPTEGESAVYNKDKERPNMGTVVKVGPGTQHVKMYLQQGYKIIYGKWAGTPVVVDGEDYLIMRQSDSMMHQPV